MIEGQATLVDVLDTAGQEEFRHVKTPHHPSFKKFVIVRSRALIVTSPFRYSDLALFCGNFFFFRFLSSKCGTLLPLQCDAGALYARRRGLSPRVLHHGTRLV